MDLVVTVPAYLDLTAVGLEGLPALGEEKFAGDLVRSPGGGAITAVAGARLGLRTALVAPLGEDVPGRFVRTELESEGVTVGGASTTRVPARVTAMSSSTSRSAPSGAISSSCTSSRTERACT